MSEPGQKLPPETTALAYPFFYASLTVCEVLYLVDAERLRPFLKDTGMALATFEDGQACAGFNFQMYTSQFSNGMGQTEEIELNILVYPESEAANVPQVTFRELVDGYEQSKLLGNHRVWVPCNDPIAITAGEEKFGEPKFLTQFISNVPSLNSFPPVGTWNFTCCDPHFPPPTSGGDDGPALAHAIFTCDADLRRLDPGMSNPSPITEYGTYGKGKEMIGARWNILQPFQTWYLEAAEARERVKVTYGTSTHPMRKAMEEMLGNAPARVVRTVQSPPAAIQSRSYYPWPGTEKPGKGKKP